MKDDSKNSKKLIKRESLEDLNKPGTWSDKINETLREEIKATHRTYKILLDDKEKENEELYQMLDKDRESSDKIESLYKVQLENLKLTSREIESENKDLREEISATISSEKEWIGRTLKLEFILKKMIQAAAIKPDHSEWVVPMFEDIQIPPVPISIKEDFVPTTLTGVVGDSSEEEEDEEFINIIPMNPSNLTDIPQRNHIERIIPTENITIDMINEYYAHVYPEEEDDEEEDEDDEEEEEEDDEEEEEDEDDEEEEDEDDEEEEDEDDGEEEEDEDDEEDEEENSLLYGRASTFDEVSIYPDPPGHDFLPWYIKRYPTPVENIAIITIQKAWVRFRLRH